MLTPAKLKAVEPALKKLTEEELAEVQAQFAELTDLMFEVWQEAKARGSKRPVGVLKKLTNKANLKL